MPNEAVQARPACTFLQQRSASFKAEHTTSQGAPHRRSGTRAITGPARVRLGTGRGSAGRSAPPGSGTPGPARFGEAG